MAMGLGYCIVSKITRSVMCFIVHSLEKNLGAMHLFSDINLMARDFFKPNLFVL